MTIGYPVLLGDQYPNLVLPEQLLRSTMYATYVKLEESSANKVDEKPKEGNNQGLGVLLYILTGLQ